MRILGYASGAECRHAGCYVAVMADDSNGWCLTTTDDIRGAQRWADHAAAHAAWNAIDSRHPWRPDGEPNKPMTAYSVAVREAP